MTDSKYVSEFRAPEVEWEDFKKKFDKFYGSEDTDKYRFEIFKQNLQEIEAHNKKFANGEVTWRKGINQFADMTQEEFHQTMLKPQEDFYKRFTSSV